MKKFYFLYSSNEDVFYTGNDRRCFGVAIVKIDIRFLVVVAIQEESVSRGRSACCVVEPGEINNRSSVFLRNG